MRADTNYDVLIIGAGAAGLLAMKTLVESGLTVCLLEATEKPGGRIRTLNDPDFSGLVEAGAEFIHGNASVTLGLLKEAGIGTIDAGGRLMTIQNGVWFEEEDREDHFRKVDEKIRSLEHDCSIQEFMSEHFPLSEYEALSRNVKQFSEGFGLADTSNASVQALEKELHSMDEPQLRIKGGYGNLIQYLQRKCDRAPSVIHYNSPVYKLEHTPGNVTAHTSHGVVYNAPKVIVTISAGVMQSRQVTFVPELPEYQAAYNDIGYGSVIKFLFSFKEPFWATIAEDAGFFFSTEFIPTWWTQHPNPRSLITGWLGGPGATVATQLPGDELYELALSSLSNIFHIEKEALRKCLTHHRIMCWDNQPYIKGGYSYNKVESVNAKKILMKPVNDTVYFAGEAVYSGDMQGTVEAALVSGKETATRIIKSFEIP